MFAFFNVFRRKGNKPSQPASINPSAAGRSAANGQTLQNLERVQDPTGQKAQAAETYAVDRGNPAAGGRKAS